MRRDGGGAPAAASPSSGEGCVASAPRSAAAGAPPSTMEDIFAALLLNPAQLGELRRLLEQGEIGDLETVRLMTGADWTELGVKIGPKRKILKCLAATGHPPAIGR